MAKGLSKTQEADVKAALRDGTPIPSGIRVNFDKTPPWEAIPDKELAEIEKANAQEREAAEQATQDAEDRLQRIKEASVAGDASASDLNDLSGTNTPSPAGTGTGEEAVSAAENKAPGMGTGGAKTKNAS